MVNGECNICISPNGGCVAVATEGIINVIAFSPFFLGEKGKIRVLFSEKFVMLSD